MLFLNTPKWRSFGESVRIVITTIMAIVLGGGVRKEDNEDFIVI